MGRKAKVDQQVSGSIQTEYSNKNAKKNDNSVNVEGDGNVTLGGYKCKYIITIQDKKVYNLLEKFYNQYVSDAVPNKEDILHYLEYFEELIINQLMKFDQNVSHSNVNQAVKTNLDKLQRECGRLYKEIMSNGDKVIKETKILHDQNEKLIAIYNSLVGIKDRADENGKRLDEIEREEKEHRRTLDKIAAQGDEQSRTLDEVKADLYHITEQIDNFMSSHEKQSSIPSNPKKEDQINSFKIYCTREDGRTYLNEIDREIDGNKKLTINTIIISNKITSICTDSEYPHVIKNIKTFFPNLNKIIFESSAGGHTHNRL